MNHQESRRRNTRPSDLQPPPSRSRASPSALTDPGLRFEPVGFCLCPTSIFLLSSFVSVTTVVVVSTFYLSWLPTFSFLVATPLSCLPFPHVLLLLLIPPRGEGQWGEGLRLPHFPSPLSFPVVSSFYPRPSGRTPVPSQTFCFFPLFLTFLSPFLKSLFYLLPSPSFLPLNPRLLLVTGRFLSVFS